MKNRIVLILSILFFSHTLSAQIDTILLPYDATSLTQEQLESNPSVLAYPTSLQYDIPEMKCTYTFMVDAEGHSVVFSKGNLQYQASTNTWRFAEHQWDYVGNDVLGTVYENGVKCNNLLISSTYSGWIDLFGWGTSGWQNGYSYYYPYLTTEDQSLYPQYSLIDDAYNGRYYANADWGIYNQIGSDAPGTWRTLTGAQWKYIVESRPNASSLIGKARIDTIDGFILLPDEWKCPQGITFTPTDTYDGFETNSYSFGDWNVMEKYGAIFLPHAQERSGLLYGGSSIYWSSSRNSTGWIDAFMFWAQAQAMFDFKRYMGGAVRLVKDFQEK